MEEGEEGYEEIEQYSCVVCHEMHGLMFRERETSDYYCEDCMNQKDKKLEKKKYPPCGQMPLFYNGQYGGSCENNHSECEKCQERYDKNKEVEEDD